MIGHTFAKILIDSLHAIMIPLYIHNRISHTNAMTTYFARIVNWLLGRPSAFPLLNPCTSLPYKIPKKVYYCIQRLNIYLNNLIRCCKQHILFAFIFIYSAVFEVFCHIINDS